MGRSEGPGVGELQPVGALLDQSGIDIHDRGQPDDVADLLAVQAVGIAGAVEELVVVQHHVEHFGRETALHGQRVIAAEAVIQRFLRVQHISSFYRKGVRPILNTSPFG